MLDWIELTLINIATYSLFLIGAKIISVKQKITTIQVLYAGWLVAMITFLPFFLASLSNAPLFSQDAGFFYALLAILLANLGFTFYALALQTGDLSLISPLENLRPLFVAALSVILLGTTLSLENTLGILLISVGAFALHLQKSLTRTIKAVFTTRESKLMLASGIAFAFTAIMDKVTLNYTKPLTYSFLALIGLTLFSAFASSKQTKTWKPVLNKHTITIGLLIAPAHLAIISAVSLQTPALVVPLQMTRTLLLAVLGYFLFREKNIKQRLAGAAVMLAGVYLLLN